MNQNTPHVDDHPELIYTVANVITVVRLLLVPFAFSVLVSRDNDVIVYVQFANAAAWRNGVRKNRRPLNAVHYSRD